jgi:hypothetical protein
MSLRHCQDVLPSLRGKFIALHLLIKEIFPDNLTTDQYTPELLAFLQRRVHEEIDQCL